MATVVHSTLTGAELHDPRGKSTQGSLDLVTNTVDAYLITDTTTAEDMLAIDTTTGSQSMHTDLTLVKIANAAVSTTASTATIRLSAGDGTSPPLDSLYRGTIALGSNGRLTFSVPSSLNGAGFSEASTVYNFSEAARTSTGSVTLNLNSASSATARPTSIVSSSAGALTITPTAGQGVAVKGHAAFAGSEALARTSAVQTTDATPTTLVTVSLSDTTLYALSATIIGRDTSGTDRAMYSVQAYAYREGGGATLGTITVVHSQETNAAWDATFATSTNDIIVQVTGAAATTINWACKIDIQAVSGSA